MATFVLENLKAGTWEPFAVWSNMPHLRAALARMETLCKQRNLDLDDMRLRPLHSEQDVEDMRALVHIRRSNNKD